MTSRRLNIDDVMKELEDLVDDEYYRDALDDAFDDPEATADLLEERWKTLAAKRADLIRECGADAMFGGVTRTERPRVLTQ